MSERAKPPHVAPAGAKPDGGVGADAADVDVVERVAVAVEAAAEEAADEASPGVVPIEDSIDLHGFQPRDIPSVVEEYTRAAAERGFREVRVIHGRGTGFQRQRVQQVLSACAWVERFADAPAKRGGWGATLVWLRPLREGE